jgi:hypothetical protein
VSYEDVKRFREKRRIEAREYLGSRCAWCGATEKLDFDHIDPSTMIFRIANGLINKAEVFWAEVAKCQLLCRDCHTEKSSAEGSFRTVGHGEGKTGKKSCRCELCGPLKNKYMREFKARARESSSVG